MKAAILFLFMAFATAAQPVRPAEPPNYARQNWDTESGLPQNTVQAILQTHDGYLWFATQGGLARFNSVRFAVFNSKNTPELRSNDLRALLEDSGYGLWIATADGIALRKNDKFTAFTTADGLPSPNVFALYYSPSGEVCAVTSAGSACFRNRHFEPVASVPGSANTAHNPFEAPRDSLFNDAILSSFKDREGNLWIGTESTGATILRDLKFRTYSDREQNLDQLVRCVFEDHRGTVWLGTNEHGLVSYYGGQFKHLTAASGLSSNVIVSLGEDAAGNLLVGTPDGLNRIHNGVVTIFTSADGLPDDFVRSIHAEDDGSVWIGTRRGLARLYQDKFQSFTHSDGLGSDLIGSMLRDAQDNLWIATLQGLSVLSAGRFINYTTKDGLSSMVVTSLYDDHHGAIWIGTQGGGLNRFANGAFQHFPTSVGLPDVLYGITEDDSGNLWIASDSGIFRASRLDLERYLAGDTKSTPEVVGYDTSDGLRVNECSGGGHPGLARTSDGSIWFATLRGAANLRAHLVINRVPPPVTIESVTIDDKSFDPAEVKSIPPGHTRLAFDYAALSFTAPQKVRFRYRLEGFDANWVEAGSARTAYYTNLAPGSYVFRVIARNNDGVWNEQGAGVSFRLEPHFYQTYWFLALMLTALGFFGYGVYRSRVRQVEAQFSAVLQERNRIAREIHDTLAQGFAGVSVQLELVSRLLGASVGSARQHLDQARMLVRESLAEARRSIWELRSHSAEIEDLAGRLGKMANQVGGLTTGKIALQVRGTYRPLPPRVEDELLRIAQEAVTNAIRHADPRHINIELAFDAKRLRMTVADDGRGFIPGVKTTGEDGHFGLQGMRERAQQIDAEFNVQSTPGQGTKVSVEAPVA